MPELILCPICGEKKKDRKSKVHYDPNLSDRSKNKLVYFCTNHEDHLFFTREIFKVKNVIVSVRQYIFYGRIPK